MANYQKQLEELQRRTITLEKRLGDVYGSLIDLKSAMQQFIYRYRREILTYQAKLVQVQREITDIRCLSEPELRAPGEAKTPLTDFLFGEVGSVQWQVERVGQRGTTTKGVRGLDITPVPPELQAVYSRLVARLHPALITSPTERERRRPILTKVNDAYIQRNEIALNAVHEALTHEESSSAISVVDDRVVDRMRNHIFDMEALIARLEGDLFEIRYGDAAKLYTSYVDAQKDGIDLIKILNQKTVDAIKQSVADMVALRKNL